MYNDFEQQLIDQLDLLLVNKDYTSWDPEDLKREFNLFTDIHHVDWYDKMGWRSFAQHGGFDHYFQFTDLNYEYIYSYSQPYSKMEDNPIGREESGWEVIYNNNDSIYNNRKMTTNARTITVLWRMSLDTFTMYRTKNTSDKRPTTFVNVKLDNSDRMFKQLVEIKKLNLR